MGIKSFIKQIYYRQALGSGTRCLIERAIDWIDFFYLKFYKKNLPPYSLRSHVGPSEDFERLPEEYITYFKLLCGLQMDNTILDIGCGPGRFASHLLIRPHFFKGEYFGFDVDKKAIDWANDNIAKKHGNFKFENVDVRHGEYNKDGQLKAETFSFPYSSEKFDFIFAISVFTHLFSEETQNYIHEISRVLKEGCKALITFFLMDGYPEKISEIHDRNYGRSGPPNWHHYDNYSVLYPNLPGRVVAYQESTVIKMIEQSNLRLDKIYYGAWNRIEDYLSTQDIIIVSKS